MNDDRTPDDIEPAAIGLWIVLALILVSAIVRLI